MIQANDLELARFQFDFDVTFGVLFMNADGTIYGRYGSCAREEMEDKYISLEGFTKAAERTLAIHAKFPRNKMRLANLQSQRKFEQVTPHDFAELQQMPKKADLTGIKPRDCIHCHQIHEMQMRGIRAKNEPIPDRELFAFPFPETIGLQIDPQDGQLVQGVVTNSAAAQAGIKSEDRIVGIDGAPISSIADIQWALQQIDEQTTIHVVISRQDKSLEVSLELAKGWRREHQISKRATIWDLRRMASGGMVLEELSDEMRQKHGITSKDSLALQVTYVGQYGEHAAGKNAGFKNDDIIVSVGDSKERMTEGQFVSYVLQNYFRGANVPIIVLRGKEKVQPLSLELPAQ